MDRGGEVGGDDAVARIQASGNVDVVAGSEGDFDVADVEGAFGGEEPDLVVGVEQVAGERGDVFELAAFEFGADEGADEEAGFVGVGEGEWVFDLDDDPGEAAEGFQAGGEAEDGAGADLIGKPGRVVGDGDRRSGGGVGAGEGDPFEIADRDGGLDPVVVGADEGGEGGRADASKN